MFTTSFFNVTIQYLNFFKVKIILFGGLYLEGYEGVRKKQREK